MSQSKKSALHKGQEVSWSWGANQATGKITNIQPKPVTRKIKGSEVTRQGSPESPAVEIKQADGDKVLKKASEIKPKSAKK